MNPGTHKKLLANWSRCFCSLIVLLALLSQVLGQIRGIEISRFIQTAPLASTFFRVSARFAGGVAPNGSAEFLAPEPALTKIKPSELKLTVLDRRKLANDLPDYDAIGIQWKGVAYKLTTDDTVLLPLMKFVASGHEIAYTIPEEEDNDPEYFKNNGLVALPVTLFEERYVAKELRDDDLVDFLDRFDVSESIVEPLDNSIKCGILGDIAKTNTPLGKFLRRGTWVNADFHVNYKVFLETKNGSSTAAVGGLPLRYYWNVYEKGNSVSDVEVFRFPEREHTLEYEAILFFQTAAILRQFKESNPAEFNRFLREVSSIVKEPATPRSSRLSNP